jgi:hypothetical protein
VTAQQARKKNEVAQYTQEATLCGWLCGAVCFGRRTGKTVHWRKTLRSSNNHEWHIRRAGLRREG